MSNDAHVNEVTETKYLAQGHKQVEVAKLGNINKWNIPPFFPRFETSIIRLWSQPEQH